MMRRFLFPVVAVAFAVILSILNRPTISSAAGHPGAKESKMVSAAKAFLSTLRTEQRAKAVFPFNSDERMNWHFVPQVRGGLPYKEMDGSQQRAALELLQASISASGYKKVATIRQLENV